MAGSSFLDTVFRRKKKKSNDIISSDFVRTTFRFDFDTIRAATEDFSHVIGRGGFGSVYKGRLQDGGLVAVKRFSGTPNRIQNNFRNEVNILSRLRHKNLINLLGFCSKQDQHCLVFEYMANSSLDRYIFDTQGDSHLNWEMYQTIIEGIARGIRYIHEESGLWAVHRDINPSNILLDYEMKPKIAGFGLARLMQNGDYEPESTNIAGTFGYLAPDYIITGRLSFKSDVYAFGVTILVILSRRKPCGISDEEHLITYVMRCWNRGEAINVIHEVMREEGPVSEMLRYIHIALLCIDENMETRPSIDKVLHWFSCLSTPLPEPTFGTQFLAEAETNRPFSQSLSPSSSPSLSPGHNSVM